MKSDFGKRMATLRRFRENQREAREAELRDRLWKAVKIEREVSCWEFTISERLEGAVRTITAMGWKAELRFQEGKMKLYAVEYKRP